MSAEGESEKSKPTIRIVKKKIVAGGHHGGAWKVAYADFVTAMMAFFLVMWIISMDQAVKERIQDFFENPSAATRAKSGISRMSAGGLSPISIGAGVGLPARNWRELAMQLQRDRFIRTQQALQSDISRRADLSKLQKQVEIRVTSYGLSIELVEAEKSPFFERGSATLPKATIEILQLVGKELSHLPNPVWVEGHTDSMPYGPGALYTNWELSADRANAARRVLEQAGIRHNQILQVRGYADSRLRRPNQPHHPSNRRVSIVAAFQEVPKDKQPPSTEDDQQRQDDAEKGPIVASGENEYSPLLLEHLRDKETIENNMHKQDHPFKLEVRPE